MGLITIVVSRVPVRACFHSTRAFAASAAAGMVWTGIFSGTLSSAKPGAGVGHRFPDGQESGIR